MSSPPINPIDISPVPTSELIFNSGFENTTIIQTNAQMDEFRGKDLTFSTKNDWVTDFANHPNVGYVRNYYEEGDSTQRRARIVAEPLNPSNKVLNYKLLTPHIAIPASSQYTVNGIVFDKKARIQMDIYGNTDLKEVYQSVRLFIPTDFNKLVNSAYPASGDWITLFEFWNNAQWNPGATYPFRFGVTLSKIAPGTVGSPFFFKVEAQKLVSGFVTVWEKSNTGFQAPIGKWMTIEYYIKDGNKGNGRFYFAVTPDGGTKTVVYDLKEDTCHPDDPNPDGLGDINPIKLYTSNNMVNQMNARNGIFQVYWDDFKFWKNKRP
ncbi:hypothetical protein GJU39_12870 [Pedobacter petrophilus]|uniref:Uncharacterized protein n=1 Tax=Pedobacter petrophilus TaxID=1908241 RepID=A0A7K0G186_9SPHI|nr:hypothetical protein [Pedobacter petrophilus]MRX76979.1 hypothetical protein [Pedobacter petrophilus]